MIAVELCSGRSKEMDEEDEEDTNELEGGDKRSLSAIISLMSPISSPNL